MSYGKTPQVPTFDDNVTNPATTNYVQSQGYVTNSYVTTLVAPQIVQSGLIAQYNMTDSGGSNGYTLTDSSGNANHGTLGDQAPITNLSLTTNVITVTCTNDFTVGQVVVLSGLTTTPSLNGTSLTVLAGGLSSSQFTANLTHANISSAAETGFAVVTATVPTFIAGTGGLKFVYSSLQRANLPSAVNSAKTMLFVTFFDPAATQNEYGSPISPNMGNSGGPNLMYTYAQSTNSPSGNQNYRAFTWNGANQTGSLGTIHGYAITTLVTAVGGDLIYNYTTVGSSGSTIGTLGSGNYQLGGGHGAGAQTWFNGQILFAAFWSGSLTTAQVTQNVQAAQQLLLQRGLVLDGIPANGSRQTPDYVDTFCLDGDSETTYLSTAAQFSTVPGIGTSVNIMNSGQTGQTAETINSTAPFWVDVNLPNSGIAANGGNVGQGATKAGVIIFIGTNDSSVTPVTGSLGKYCRDRKKAGWNKVYIVTQMSRGAAPDTVKNQMNTAIRSSWQYWADGLVDVGANPNWGADGASNNTLYMSGIHWSQSFSFPMQGQFYSFAMRRMYGNTINGVPNTASASTYLVVPEDIYLFADTTSNTVDLYLPSAQLLTGQTITIKARAGASNALTIHPKTITSGTITATSLVSTTLTVTVPNTLLPGDPVVFAGLNTNTTKNGFIGTVITANSTQFTMTVTAASWSGSDTTGTVSLANLTQFAAITNLSLTSNVATITAANNFVSGDSVTLTGLTTTPGLNGTIAVVSATGLSGTAFQVPITHADIVSGAEAGYSYKVYPAETIDGSSTLAQTPGTTAVLLSVASATTTGLANWVVVGNGTLSDETVTKTTTYTATNADQTINCNGTFTLTLPTTLAPGKKLTIKNVGTGVVTLSSAVNIDGATTFTLTTQYQSVVVQWDGTQWWIY